jgi:hypothetical protein
VTQTMTKYAVDRRGAIAFKGSHEVDDAGKWLQLLERLAKQ